MTRSCLLAAALLGAPLVAGAADGIERRWSISLQGGTEFGVAGDVQQAGQGTIVGLPATVEAQKYGDVYGRSFRGAFALGYGIGRSLEVFLRGERYASDSRSRVIGDLAGLDLFGDYGRYQEWTAEAGVRYYLAPRAAWKPYLAVGGGARFSSEVRATFTAPDANLTLSNLPFLGKSTVAVFGADIGLSRDLSRRMAVGAEIGLRRQTAPQGQDTGLQGTALENINDGAGRWSVPVSLQVTLRF